MYSLYTISIKLHNHSLSGVYIKSGVPRIINTPLYIWGVIVSHTFRYLYRSCFSGRLDKDYGSEVIYIVYIPLCLNDASFPAIYVNTDMGKLLVE